MVAQGQNLMVGRREVRQFTPITEELLEGTGWTLEKLVKNGTVVEVEVFSPEKEKPKKKTTSPWQFDPAKLKKLDVEKLNLMIADIDSEVGPFETRDEALAQLTKDFQGTS